MPPILSHLPSPPPISHSVAPRVIQARLGQAATRLSMELYAHVPDAADRQVAAHLDQAWTGTPALQ